MAKESGLGWTTLEVDSSDGTVRTVINDVTDLSFATPRAVQDTTGIDSSAMERLLLLADFSIDLNWVFNDAALAAAGTQSGIFTVMKTVSSTSVERTTKLVVSGQTLENECLFTDCALTRSSSGELTGTSPGVLSDGTVPTWT